MKRPAHRLAHQRGFTLVAVAIAAVAMVGMLGLAVDVGRMFIAKNEIQAFCDSTAIAAGLELDGANSGINNARSVVTGSLNTWNLGSTKVTTSTTPTIEFSTAGTGEPWVTDPSPPKSYSYVRVTVTVSENLYFIPMVSGAYTTSIKASAVAGQVPITSFPRGLAPYTAVGVNSTGPDFGLTVGNIYDIQWPQFNSTRAGCNDGNPSKCFTQSR